MPGFDFLKREKIWLGGVACLGVGAMIVFDRTRTSAPAPIVWEEKPAYSQTKPAEPSQAPAETSVTVDVDGAVKNPGVYTLPAGSRLKDALTAAGGAWSNADLSGYNRAARLVDGTKITVPKRESVVAERRSSGRRVASARRPRGLSGDIGSVPPLAVEVPEAYRSDGNAYKAEALPEPSASPSSESKPKTKSHSSGKKEVHAVNVNAAGADELCALPGVGPSTAAAIVAYRTEHGPFTSVEALDGVKGIGPKKLEAMRPYVRL